MTQSEEPTSTEEPTPEGYAPPVGWSSYDPALDWDEDTADENHPDHPLPRD